MFNKVLDSSNDFTTFTLGGLTGRKGLDGLPLGVYTNEVALKVAVVSGTIVVNSEFPAAAVLADATANPTTTVSGAFLSVFNGTTWDRARGTTLGLYTLDNGAAWTTVMGVSGARFTSADQSAAVASVTDAPTTGQKIVLTDILFSSDTALRMDFSEETSGTILFSVYTSAGSSGQFTPRGKCKLATANKKLQVRTSAAGNIAVTPLYYSEA